MNTPPLSCSSSVSSSGLLLGQEAIERLAAIVAGSDDAIIGKDLSSVITSWNQGAERICKGGRRIAISATVSPIFDSNGKVVGDSKIARDITK